MTVFDRLADWLFAQGGLAKIGRRCLDAAALILIGLAPIAIVGGWILLWLFISGWDDQSDLFVLGVLSPLGVAIVAGLGVIVRLFWEDLR